MTVVSTRTKIAARGARRGVKAYGAAKRAQGRASARTSRQASSHRPSAPQLLAGTAFGAACAYLLDPQQGRRRRHEARDRGLALVRRTRRDATRRADYAAGIARGRAHEAAHAVRRDDGRQPPDDVTLARKVETIIFRDRDAPKGQVSVNAENGVVYLRGTLERQEEIQALVDQARAVDGVQRVENLLHQPDRPSGTG